MGNKAYGLYAWVALLAVVAPVSILLLLTPGIMRRRRLVRRGARLVCALTGSRITVTGWPIPDGLPCIVVANHSSYLDGIILTAVLPPQFAFLIKQEMANVPVAGFVLKQIAAEFVDRQNPQDRHRMARRLVETARRGWTLVVFPEGTFEVAPGLKRFHSGAFRAAWRGKLPIVPIAIRGARAKMPAETILPATGSLSVHVCEPIQASSAGSAESLMAATRAAILAKLDEPDREAPGVDYIRA
jgi:1-acyl-sn-glycerol-3-phosphate acyltransferase